MLWLARRRATSALKKAASATCLFQWIHSRTPVRHIGTSKPLHQPLRQIPLLASWDAEIFHERAYLPALPARLPCSPTSLPPACQKWFIHNGDPNFNLIQVQTPTEERDGDITAVQIPRSSELRPSFWSRYESTIVPLELTSEVPPSPSPSPSDQAGTTKPTTSADVERETQTQIIDTDPIANDSNIANTNTNTTNTNTNNQETFHRVEAPLKLLLTYLSTPSSSSNNLPSGHESSHPHSHSHSHPPRHSHSIYLAQCELPTLPAALQTDIPPPSILTPRPTTRSRSRSSTSIKGDIYSSSLWLGRPPTYTPLHRDPNPNLFVQLCGRKSMRLLPPEIGDAVFADVQARLLSTLSASPNYHPTLASYHPTSSPNIRGEEMMSGPEKAVLHDAVWCDDTQSNRYAEVMRTYAFEVELGLGEGLFIPRGWWHSVKGVGEGVTASVNWWFR